MTEPQPNAKSDDNPVVDLDETAEALPTTFSITSYGADYPVDGLVKRLEAGDIVVPLFSQEPIEGQTTVGFQREFVWKKPQADKFVESLLLGLPVPGIFLVKEPNGKLLVLDGQQRLRTLQSFYRGIFQGSEFKLEAVQAPWKGKAYRTLHADDRRRLDNSIIHAIVVRQDEPSEDQSSIYLIFERLNSGGTILQPQEIRVALYHGTFGALLSRLNDDPNWRDLFGRKSSRLKDIELILRFLALYFDSTKYGRPMKAFLNNYMAENRFLARQDEKTIRHLFESTVSAIRSGIGTKAFRPFGSAVNAAVLDSVMVGVAGRISSGKIGNLKDLRGAYDQLIKSQDYLAAVTRATADEDSVHTRLKAARAAFADIQ